jgi:hypothetical protein
MIFVLIRSLPLSKKRLIVATEDPPSSTLPELQRVAQRANACCRAVSILVVMMAKFKTMLHQVESHHHGEAKN